MCDQQRLRPACAYAQSDQSLCQLLEYSTTVKLLTEHHLEFQSLKGGCRGSSESTLVKMPHCWKSHVTAHFHMNFLGIPEQADIANTFYSQFEEDFTPSDSDDEDEQAQTVIRRKTGDSDDDADVMFGSDGASQIDTEVTLTKKDDEDELYNHLQYVLDKNEDAGEGILLTINFLKFRPFFSLFSNKNVGNQGCYSQNVCQNSKQGRP